MGQKQHQKFTSGKHGNGCIKQSHNESKQDEKKIGKK